MERKPAGSVSDIPFDKIFEPLNSRIHLSRLHEISSSHSSTGNSLKVTCHYRSHQKSFQLQQPLSYHGLVTLIEMNFGSDFSIEGSFSGEFYFRLSSQEDVDEMMKMMPYIPHHSDLKILIIKEDANALPLEMFKTGQSSHLELLPPGHLPNRTSRPSKPGAPLNEYVPEVVENQSYSGGHFCPEIDEEFNGHQISASDSKRNNRMFIHSAPHCPSEGFIPDESQTPDFLDELVTSNPLTQVQRHRSEMLDNFQQSPMIKSIPATCPAKVSGHYVPLDFTKLRRIGSGGFGQVFLCVDNTTNQKFAVKQVLVEDQSEMGLAQLTVLQNELEMHASLNHPHIVQYYGSHYDNGTLFLFMEYMPGGSVKSRIDQAGPLAESQARRYTQQILQGLSYLHRKGIAHRDIKGANVLCNNSGNVKLSDFGASKQLHTLSKMKSLCGTCFYLSPEAVRGEGYGISTDIWSLGCTVVEMLSGNPPWHKFDNQISVMFHIVQCDKPQYDLPAGTSATARDFLAQCFIRDPLKRPSADYMLMHAFVCGVS